MQAEQYDMEKFKGWTLPDRLAAAMSELERAQHDKKRDDPGGKYPYASADEVFQQCRKKLAKYGVIPRHTIETANISAIEGVNKYGKKEVINYLDLHAKLWFVCAGVADDKGFGRREFEEEPEGAFIRLRWAGPESYEAAGSRIVKGWLRRRLLLDTGDPDEHENEENGQTAAQQEAKQATQTATDASTEAKEETPERKAFKAIWDKYKASNSAPTLEAAMKFHYEDCAEVLANIPADFQAKLREVEAEAVERVNVVMQQDQAAEPVGSEA